jgi:hypothetical protein
MFSERLAVRSLCGRGRHAEPRLTPARPASRSITFWSSLTWPRQDPVSTLRADPLLASCNRAALSEGKAPLLGCDHWCKEVASPEAPRRL